MKPIKKTELFKFPSNIAEIDPRLERCLFLVEATDFEKQALRDKYETQELYKKYRDEGAWISDSSGFALQIAELAGRPLMVSFTFATIRETPVLFYENISQLVDHDATERFLRQTFHHLEHDGGRWSHCNALNFHQFLHAAQDLRLQAKAMSEKRDLDKSTLSAAARGPGVSSPRM